MNNGSDKVREKSLQAMDTAALHSLLLMELSADGELNDARIQEISNIIAEREQFVAPDVDAAWEDFQQNYMNSEPLHTLEQDDPQPKKSVPKRKIWKRSFLLAAILVVLFIGATVTTHATNFWEVVAKWTSETFGFSFGDGESHSVGNILDNEELAPLWNAMTESGISDPRLPTDLPDGFTQIDFVENSEAGFWCAAYQSGDDLIQIQVQKSQEASWSKLQKDSIDPEIYIWNEMEFYFITNMGQLVVTWSSGEYEYLISGASEPEIHSMIESIYKEEPK